MPQETFIPTETSTHLEFRNVFNSNAVEAEQRLTFLEERLDLDVHDPLKSYSVGEMFYYSAKAYRVNTDLNVGETPTTNPEKVDQIGVAIGSEVNDLTSSVTWADVPDANITQSSVIQHTGAFAIYQSQIVDAPTLGTMATEDTGDYYTKFELDTISAENIAIYDPNLVTGDSFLMSNFIEDDDAKVMTSGEREKLSHISVTQAIDLDNLGGGHTIQDEGTPLTARTNLNFVGAGVEATDDAGNDATIVTINGGGGGSSGTSLSGTTANNTQTEIFVDGVASSRMTLTSNTTWMFSAMVAARSATESAGYKIEGVIKNDAGTTALVGTAVKTVFGEDDSAWDVTVEADDTNDALVFKVIGDTVDSVNWEVLVDKLEVS